MIINLINSYKILFLYPKNDVKTFTSKGTQIQNKSDLINDNNSPIKARKSPSINLSTAQKNKDQKRQTSK